LKKNRNAFVTLDGDQRELVIDNPGLANNRASGKEEEKKRKKRKKMIYF